ncbi:MAG TPA: histidine--tRNA ligase, partial [Candidatus Altiarchaeales archaeon]|nr:histidine--tRNA ligase [Candidatus Altiarchaeales archaeon]
MAFARPRGTRDFTPVEMSVRRQVLEGIREVFEGAGYREIQTPLFEETSLFLEKSGPEIVTHLYNFADKGGREICLRPEATASVARFFTQELRQNPKPLRLYYHGPMYRYERPQKGRYREFFQTGVELIGAESVEADAEIIWLASQCLSQFSLKHKLRISHLGVLKEFLKAEGLDDKQAGEIISFIDRDLMDEVDRRVKSPEFKKIMRLCGKASVLKDAEKLLKGKDAAFEKLKELEKVCGLLDEVGV